MVPRSLLITVVCLLFACPAFAQFGQPNRLADAAARLSRDAEDFANSNYNAYTNSFRSSREEIEGVMLSQQFSAAARIFYRMVVDRRRSQDLRDAYDLLQNLARSVERNNFQRSAWYNVQRSLTEVSRELNYDTSSAVQLPNSSGRGHMTWKGRVDDDIRITIRGGTAEVQTIGGTPYYDARSEFAASLPPRRVSVKLDKKRGRGEVYIEQQPSRENDFAVVVRIKDPRGGASDYEFELSW